MEGKKGRKKEREKRKKEGRKEGRTVSSREGSNQLKEGRKKKVSQAQQGNNCMLHFSVTQLPNYMITTYM